MSAEQVVDYWHRLHLQQIDWGFDAYERLLKTFSPDVQEKLSMSERAPEPYIAIFGKTQVGKTTLLLDLMGVDPQKMERISLVLRGGRAQGESATATTMEYCRSLDERWGLTESSQSCWYEQDEDSKISRALGLLREKMERGDLQVTSPCIVHIPQSFFPSDSKAPSIRILDLPGHSAANRTEQEYVSHMAKTYLPFADLILLVVKGDDLSSLEMGKITLPGIEDWQSMPNRFRVITTYSYTAESVQKFINESDSIDAGKLVQRLVQEIERFSPLHDGFKQKGVYQQEKSLFFPLEFGPSLASFKKNKADLYEKIQPINTVFRECLLNQMKVATTPLGRLNSTRDTLKNLEFIHEKKEAAIDEAIKELTEKLDELHKNIEIQERTIEKKSTKIRSTSNTLKNNSIEKGARLIEEAVAKAHDGFKFSPNSSNTVSGIQITIRKDCQLLTSFSLKDIGEMASKEISETVEGEVIEKKDKPNPFTANFLKKIMEDKNENEKVKEKTQYWNKVSKKVVAVDPVAKQKILDDEFGYIRRKLDGYILDSYWTDQDCSDRDGVRSAGVNAKDKLFKLQKEAWLKALHVVDKELKEELESVKTEYDLMCKDLKDTDIKKDDVNKKIKTNEEEKIRIQEAAKKDLKNSDNFFRFCEGEYLVQLTNRMNTAMQEIDSCNALLNIFSCCELSNTYKEFINFHESNSQKTGS